VARVDELMSRCDELEWKQKHCHSVRRRFQTSALDALANAESTDELAEAWQRVRENWDAVTEHSDCVPVLRRTIVELAVQGRLGPRGHAATTGHESLALVGNGSPEPLSLLGPSPFEVP